MNKNINNNQRLIVCKILQESLPHKHKPDFKQQTLQQLFPKYLHFLEPQTRALTSHICFGVFRHYFLLSALLDEYLKKPLKNKDQDIFCILIAGAYELFYLSTPQHAVISESVNLCDIQKKTWAKALVNAVLRNIQRSQFTPDTFKTFLKEKNKLSDEILFEHPDWFIKKICADWPEKFSNILMENNQRAPLVLRVNRNKCSREDYLALLAKENFSATASKNSEFCIYLHDSVDVKTLPNFLQGWVSVQDEAAQQAAPLLELESKQYVLDACAAPGGKSTHILETNPSIKLLCLELKQDRLEKIHENLERLNLQAQCLLADAEHIDNWWDGTPFDRILLDAPCTASGIIRRNPDIKLVRRPEDVDRMAAQQARLLEALWYCLKPDGLLLYASCSVFKQENEQVISSFIHQEKSASLDEFELPFGEKRPFGYQCFPQTNANDGFFYARLRKSK